MTRPPAPKTPKAGVASAALLAAIGGALPLHAAELPTRATAGSHATNTALPWLPDELPAVPLPPVQAATPRAPEPTAAELAALAAARERAAAEERARQAAEAEARREAEQRQAVADAFAAGRAEGEAAGRADEAARLAGALAALEQALDAVEAQERGWLERLQENVCAVAVAVARHVVGRELDGDAGGLGDMVRRALAEFPIDQAVVIRVHPDDLATITAASVAALHGASPTPPITGAREARWVADPSLVPGGCLVEGRERIVDGRVDVALERVYRQLTQNHA